MSFYRKLLAGFTIAAFVAPVLAVEPNKTTDNKPSTNKTAPTNPVAVDPNAIEITENGVKVGGKDISLAENEEKKATDDTANTTTDTKTDIKTNTKTGLPVDANAQTKTDDTKSTTTNNTAGAKKQVLTNDANTQTETDDTKVKAKTTSDNKTGAKKQILTQKKLNINKASLQELTQVKGLNATKAKAIVAYRKNHGDFKSLNNLSLVRGFKRMDIAELKQIIAQFEDIV